MSVSDMTSAFQQMSSLMQATMLQAQEASGTQASGGQGGHHGHHGPDATEMFSKLDTDGDGSVTKDEFLAGKPDNVSDEQAESLWSKISGDNGDSLTQEQFVSGMQSAEQSRHAGRGGPPPGPPPGGQDEEQDATAIFDKLDTNGDGKVSQTEFLAGKPDDVSDEQASSLWSKIAGDNGDSLTEDQFVSGMQANKPKASTTSTAATDTANQLVDQLMAAINTYRSASQGKTSSTLSVAA